MDHNASNDIIDSQLNSKDDDDNDDNDDDGDGDGDGDDDVVHWRGSYYPDHLAGRTGRQPLSDGANVETKSECRKSICKLGGILLRSSS